MVYTSERSKLQTIFQGTIFLIISLFIVQCSNKYIDEIDRSGIYQYKPGFPEVTATTAGIIDGTTDSTKISVSVEIVYRSLIFKKVDSVFEASMLMEIQILDKDDTSNLINSFQYPLKATLDSQIKINNGSKFVFHDLFDASPGDYLVNVMVTDQSTNKQTIRTSSAFIPNPKDKISHVTNIRVYTKSLNTTNSFQPVTTYDLSESADSIRFSFQVTNNKNNTPLTINSKLVKFRSDTSSARPLSWPNYTPSSLSYIGISYSKFEEVASSTRLITQQGNVSIDFLFPNLDRGNYRFEVYTDEIDASENRLYRAREFSIKSKNYPSLKTPKELAAPLIYLMEKDDYNELMTNKNPVDLKMAIDKFWLNNIKNERIAQNVIELYYERVEEANKQFSNFKEGWKTDFGMMYILFGPPRYISTSINEMVWSYSTNLYDPETNFLFRNPKMKSKYYPFDNFLLHRDQQYFSVQYLQIQNWLSGEILKDNL